MPPGSAMPSIRAAMLTPSPQDIVPLDDDIANIDPDPEPDWIGVGATGVVLRKLFLDFDGAGDSVHGAREFHQRAVAHELDNTA